MYDSDNFIGKSIMKLLILAAFSVFFFSIALDRETIEDVNSISISSPQLKELKNHKGKVVDSYNIIKFTLIADGQEYEFESKEKDIPCDIIPMYGKKYEKRCKFSYQTDMLTNLLGGKKIIPEKIEFL